MKPHQLVGFAACSAAIAIVAGAFGAHNAHGPSVEWLKTGGSYQLIHAVAVIGLADRWQKAAVVILIGSLIFAFSLYAMALGAPRWFGAITPIGGALMISGWVMIAYHMLRRQES